MSNALTKAAAARQGNQNNPSLSAALKNGGPMVWLSCLVMGLTNILNGQMIKGLIYLIVEIAFIVFLVLPEGGIYYISMLEVLTCRNSKLLSGF